ncbi:TPA: molecular chaperone [Vibrio parahaemolyticus]|nr:molecular chaperone [Vibrio parahaemolyticus]EJC6731718.1 molecular chaperone [Vibrio parahaemolyticus]EJC6945298.1 molecular chaperone [Vibrio parahaemolyticus]EJC7030015.1 molecular chaperone [Vibrio parahaemolyticus]EJC7069342.1 molecular chaperone [Vibrio parahaemolyticus]
MLNISTQKGILYIDDLPLTESHLLESAKSHASESAIADSLQDAINDYSYQLEEITAWTDGGSSVISPVLNVMIDSLLNDTSNGKRSEDIMQILVLDLMVNAPNWGIDLSILGNNKDKYFGYITENFGSGMHNNYMGHQTDTPEKVINWFLDTVVTKMLPMIGSGIPVDSAAAKALNYFNLDSNKSNLRHLVSGSNYNKEDSISHNSSISTHLSPSLKLFVLAQAASDGLIEANLWNDIIVGDLSRIKELILNRSTATNRELAEWIVSNCEGWEFDKAGQLDFNRGKDGGIPVNMLMDFFNNYPSRLLTDEEIKNINRIGDTVKMIQQTLKYWIQIMRDERMAIARNI